jgi:YD repeat-containing protein
VTTGSPLEGEQIRARQHAMLMNPEAVSRRARSRTQFERLSTTQAIKVADNAFPAVIDEPAGGLPKLPAGGRLLRYVTPNAAQVALPSGRHALVESLDPIAQETAPGRFTPVALNLIDSGSAYIPAASPTAVRIPKRLRAGVRLPGLGVSLTPIDPQGSALAGAEGALDGASVLYANTQADADTIVKPTGAGFELDTLLRSIQSPRQLSFRVGLPAGARLIPDGRTGGVKVVKQGSTIAVIPAAGAHDAAGTPVPVSMSAAGDVLTLAVKDTSGELQYPIAVDPEFNTVTDSTLPAVGWPSLPPVPWKFSSPSGGFIEGEAVGAMFIEPRGSYAAGQSGNLYYQTSGDSRIYEITAEVGFPTEARGGQTYLSQSGAIYFEFEGKGAKEGEGVLENKEVVAETGVPLKPQTPFCAHLTECSPANGSERNLVRLKEVPTGSPKFTTSLRNVTVYISQPKETHSTISYNGSPEIEYVSGGKSVKTKNAFNGGWVSRTSGAFEFKAKDAGLGISETRFEYLNSGKWEKVGVDPYESGNWPINLNQNYLNGAACSGVQCSSEEARVVTFSELGSVASNGEHVVRMAARDAEPNTWSSEYAEGEETLKVDTTPPENITVTGLAGKGEELELGEVEAHVKAEASDGEKSVASAGLASLELAVDGKVFGKPSGSCSTAKGPCTASAEWSLNGAELGVGTHTLTVLATDKAGNQASRTYTLRVYRASPVAMGPGSVNPESGDFALGASDVGVSGGAGSLALTRHYDSLNPQEGQGGPLGPEWSVSLGSLANLEVLPDGSVLVDGPEGLTHFSVKKEGGFEAPAGDRSLTLEAKTNEHTETEYLLKDPSKGTTTRFTRPSGAEVWMPTVSEGPVATDTTTDTYQTAEALNEYPTAGVTQGITTGPEGNLWFTNISSRTVGKITTAGAVTEYGPLPAESDPEGIVTGADGNLWFTERYTGKIGRITPSGHVTEYPVATSSEPDGIAAGPDGNLWFTQEAGKIGTITTAGTVKEYALPAGSRPSGISVGPDGNLWFTDKGTSKIGKITTAGVITEYALPANSEPSSIAVGPDNNLWFTDLYSRKIGKITTAGVVTEYAAGLGEVNPRGISTGPDGNLWWVGWNGGKSRIVKMTTSGTTTEYPLPEGSSPEWVTAGPDGNLWFTENGKTKIGQISTSGEVVEPRLELAPHASGTCPAGESAKWSTACRGLEFVYAEKTKESIGENESQWGEYKGRLMEVDFVAYNPATKAIAKKEVAKYSYDKLGRLRAEWNPEISPALKTVYGYDAEGHVTALTSPGQESWAFTYGEMAGDNRAGRLLKATHAPASAPLWKGEAPKNTEVPKLSGSVTVGVMLGVSNGTWSNEPTAYAYQWQDCNSAGDSCSPIPGAVDENYAVAASDVGHTLVAAVTATNGGGSLTAASSATALVSANAAVTEYALPAGSAPIGITAGPDGRMWFTNSGTSKVGKIATTGGTPTEYATAGHTPKGITSGPDGNLWFVEHGTHNVDHMTTAGTLTTYSLTRANTENDGIVTGPDENLWFTEENGYIGKINTKDEVLGEYKTYTLGLPGAIAVGPDKNLWFTQYARGYIGKITPSGTISEYKVRSGSEPFGIAAGPDGNMWFTESNAGYIGKITTSGVLSEYELPSGSQPHEIVAGPEGNLWFTEYGTSKIGRITTSGAVTEYPLPSGSKPFGIAVGPDKNVWFTEYGTSKIAKLVPGSPGEPYGPQPGVTVDYNVPLSGASVPSMTESAVAQWGQKDDPVYATAIFPPDEPQSWPATGYKRATVQYLDRKARTVNVASPSGAISTSEQNEEGEVTRSLSSYGRAAALKEGCVSEAECKSAEVSKLLDTESTYNEEGDLVETLGPQHTVKLAQGKEKADEPALARNHVTYHYDEGAPAGETYALVTKMEDAAQTPSKEEFDKRVVVSSYSGQEGLGWTLREPTSSTQNPEGMKLTTTTVYDPSSGQVVETKTPAGSSGGGGAWTYAAQFGNGDFAHAIGDAVDPHGNVWVTDGYGNDIKKFSSAGALLATYGEWGSASLQVKEPIGIAVNAGTGNVYVGDDQNNRVQELNEKGEFVRAFGWGVSNGEAKLEVCTTSCKAGIAGGGTGQFNATGWVAVDSAGNVWVGDENNQRVQEFNEKGEFIRTFGWGVSNGESKFEVCTSSCHAGSTGSGNGQFSNPTGIAVGGGHVYVGDLNNNRVEEFTTEGTYVGQFGTSGSGEGQLAHPGGVAIDGSGNVYVADIHNSRVQEFSSTGSYITQIGKGGTGNSEVSEPEGVAFDGTGDIYLVDGGNNRIVKWTKGLGNAAAHNTRKIYYSPEGEAEVAACRNHPEWAGLPCQTKPVAQPEDGLPQLPVTTISYDIWDQPETVEEAFGSTIRTRKTIYDAVGRPISTEETASVDGALPRVTDEYSSTTGMLIKQSTTVGERTTSIKSVYNTLGELTEYTDADGNTAKYVYDVDGRVAEMSDSANEGKAKQTYHYDSTTGFLTELVDSSAGTFKASYDVTGRMTSETFPNAMAETRTFNQSGEGTGIEYTKTAHCAKTCPEVWFSDADSPSIHGETLSQVSTLSEEPTYTYDALGRLTQVQEVPAGEGCKVRTYGYDEEGNRTSATSREPGVEGKCASEGGTTESHSYDTGNRLADAGVTYETFGNTTKLPAADAGGSELTSEYYVDSQVSKQSQGGETIEYGLDPEERTRETISKGTTSATMISHYDGAGGALAWTSEQGGSQWTRDVPGIGGALTALQHSNGEIVLQLHDLQGNIVATASDSEAETKLLSKYNSTEFGVPSGKGSPPPYAWLGAVGVTSELPSGAVTQDGVTYVPQTGRPLQTDGVPLPLPESMASPFSRPIEAWVGSQAGEGVAIALANARQKEEERERANALPSPIPIPVGAYGCEGEGGCEGAEEEGDCPGMGACTASLKGLGQVGCDIEAGLKAGATGTIITNGIVACSHHKAKIKLELCLVVVGLHGTSAEVGCHHWWRENTRELSDAYPFACLSSENYEALAAAIIYSPNYFEGREGFYQVAKGRNVSRSSTTDCPVSIDLPPGVGE